MDHVYRFVQPVSRLLIYQRTSGWLDKSVYTSEAEQVYLRRLHCPFFLITNLQIKWFN